MDAGVGTVDLDQTLCPAADRANRSAKGGTVPARLPALAEWAEHPISLSRDLFRKNWPGQVPRQATDRGTSISAAINRQTVDLSAQPLMWPVNWRRGLVGSGG